MKRRMIVLSALSLPVMSLPACSVLPSQPYTERREWPLDVRRATAAAPRPRGPVLAVRSVQPGPGLTQRGLQWLQPDGSVQIDFYEQWAVPPAQGVEASLRQWLAESGLFAAVLGPGSRLNPDLILEAELTALIAEPRAGVARAALAIVLLDQRGTAPAVVTQQTVRGEAPITGGDVPALVQALREAVADMLRRTEQVLGRNTRRTARR